MIVGCWYKYVYVAHVCLSVCMLKLKWFLLLFFSKLLWMLLLLIVSSYWWLTNNVVIVIIADFIAVFVIVVIYSCCDRSRWQLWHFITYVVIVIIDLTAF